MDGNSKNNHLQDFYNRLTGTQDEQIDINKLSSSQRARFIAWCIENELDHNDFLEPISIRPPLINQEYNRSDFNNFEFGIGIDIQIKSELFPESYLDLKSELSLSNIFTQREIAYAELRKDPLETLTGIFAAKEAIIKSSPSFNFGLLSEIEIDHKMNGSPIFTNYKISISHNNGIAVAVAIHFSLDNLINNKVSKLVEEPIKSNIFIIDKNKSETYLFEGFTRFLMNSKLIIILLIITIIVITITMGSK